MQRPGTDLRRGKGSTSADALGQTLQSSPLPVPAHKQALSHRSSLANSLISHLPLNLDKEDTELQRAQTLKQANSCPNPDFSKLVLGFSLLEYGIRIGRQWVSLAAPIILKTGELREGHVCREN